MSPIITLPTDFGTADAYTGIMKGVILSLNQIKKGITENIPQSLDFYLAEGLGFEPRLTGPEPVVLPLDDPPIKNRFILELVTQVKKNFLFFYTLMN